MANSDSPRGFVPIEGPGGGEPRVHHYKVTSTYTTNIAPGTPLIGVAAGFVQPLAVTTIGSQVSIRGVAAEWRAGSVGKTTDIAVWDDPDQLFLVQAGMTTAVAQAMIHATARILNPASVNTTTRLSKAEIDTIGTTANAPVRIVGKHKRVGNDFGSANADLIVKFMYGKHMGAAEAGV